MPRNSRERFPRVAAALGLAAAFAACGRPARLPEDQIAERSSRRGGYRFIDPLLDCAQSEGRQEVRPFRAQLQALADRLKAGKNATLLAAYFRDLRNGSWFGINEKEEFLPASLLKVPMMISVFRAEEEKPGVLEEVLAVPDELPATAAQRFASTSPVVLGSTYPVSALVSTMVRQSDNAAMYALFGRHGSSGIQALYGELGVSTPEDGVPDHLRVKDYASLFRVLYNGSYLGRRLSERALGELSQTAFNDGLTAPLPRGIPVAHKYGERELATGERQLHDCGIVYYPGHPYILCVMTRGRDWDELAAAIQEVSSLAYREVSRQFPAREREPWRAPGGGPGR